jgi:predicted permease
MDNFGSQLRQVLRRFGRAPAFTLIALITVAAGVGANTAVFSVLEGVMLKPLPYPHADRLVGVWHSAPGINLPQLNMAPSNYFIYREQGRYFEDVGIYQGDAVNVTGTGKPERVNALDLTDGVLPIVGIQPMLGRLFTREDDSPNASDTVILTYRYWRRKFGGDRSVVGHTLNADGKLRQIIGVMPQNFEFMDMPDLDAIFPMRLDRGKVFLGQFSYEGIARLKPGATLVEANTDVARMLPIVLSSFPPPPGFSLNLFQQARIGPDIHPLKQDVVGDASQFLWILMGSVTLVLLIACANVANLLLVRAEGRQQELAIRSALGASRGRIAGDLLFESLAIGLTGSVLGLGLAYGALRILVAMAPAGLPRVEQIGIDLPVLFFTLFASLVASLLFGLIPVLKYAGSHLGAGLREGGRTLSQSRERHRARNTLVVVQVGLASVLLICSGLMIRTFRALMQVNPGFSVAADTQTLRITIPETEVKDPEAATRTEQAVADKIAAVPGVSTVAFGNAIPMTNNHWHDPVFAQDHQYKDGEMAPLQLFRFSSPGFFQAMGTPLLAGRDYTWDDIYQRRPVAIVSEKFARAYWQSPTEALGKQIRVSTKDDWRQVVGVVADVYADGTSQEAPSTVYWPILMNHFEVGDVQVTRSVCYVVRTPRAGEQSLTDELQKAVWSVDGNLPVVEIHTLQYFYQRSMARTSFTLTMIAIAGAMALLLGMIGLYGVIAYSVSQRTREIGIRIALGAQREVVTSMFVRQGLALAAVGVAIGLAGAAATTRLMASILFRVSPVDPMTYLLVCAGLVAIAAFASYIPSRQAAVVDPIEALRTE